jgi:sugar lactone lactonase YvrE
MGSTAAQAEVTYPATAFFGSEGSGNGQFNPTGRLAVDDSSGQVFAIDRGAHRIEVFSPEEKGFVYTAKFGGSVLISPTGIAIDQSNGDVYVSDAGAKKILRFAEDGSLDPSFSSPVEGAGAGQIGNFAAPLAFDSSAGRLLVADPGNNRVDRFKADGSFESSFDGSSSGTAFTALMDLTVLPGGNVVVVDASRAERFQSSGADVGPLQGLPAEPSYVAYDPHSKEILVAHTGEPFAAGVYRVDATTNQFLGSISIPETLSGTLSGMVARGDDSGQVFVGSNAYFGVFGVTGVQVFDTLILPEVTIAIPSAVTATTTHLAGTVNPVGEPATKYHFEYSVDSGATWKLTPEGALNDESEAPKPVDVDVTGLVPNSKYQVRLTASNADGFVTSEVREFSTSVSPPEVSGESATDITTDSAVLHGTIDPFGLPTTYHFEYGTSTAYGNRVPVDFEAPAGAAQGKRPFILPIQGLLAGTTYHFRLLAKSPAGQTIGFDHTFTTTTAPRGSRAYELVTPPDKGNSSVGSAGNFMASPAGDAISFQTNGSLPLPGVDSQPARGRYVASRMEGGWTSRGADPGQGLRPEGGLGLFILTPATSDDGRFALGISSRALAPGAVEGDSNLYVREMATGAYTTVATAPGLGFLRDVAQEQAFFVDATPDFSHVLIVATNDPFLPGAPHRALYEFTNGHLEVVSRDLDGNQLGEFASPGTVANEPRFISDDGSRLFYADGLFSFSGVIYARVDGETRVVSRSHRSADAGAVSAAVYAGTDRQGRYGYFFSDESLTDDPGTGTALYRYVTATDSLERLGSVGPSPAIYRVSDDGSSVYFRSEGNIYVWRGGTVRFVTALDPARSFTYPGESGVWQASISPNGRYLAIATAAQLTSYDNSDPTSSCKDVGLVEGGITGVACMEVYRYDAETDEMTCASCRPDGLPPVNNAMVGLPESVSLGHHFPRLVNDEGDVLFSTPEQLIGADSNKVPDVYEFDGTAARLISSGRGGPSLFVDMSESGDDVFFVTEDRLVGLDTDNVSDVYDARIGGVSQNPPPPREECIRDDCKSTPNQGPELPFGGSEQLNGPEDFKPKPRLRCRKGRHLLKAKGKQRCVKVRKHRTDTNRRQGR